MSDIEEDTNTVTAIDYLINQEKLQKQAQEILPGKFEKCSFHLGYIRQPLYACKTCQENSGEVAGMCYSCSISCHSSHDLFELFPKRHFRCDCGIKGKFSDHPCSLMIPAKKIINENAQNKYNHNFKGYYCRCNQLYDPDKEEDPMYQCLGCEDWFHERCIGIMPDIIADFECYICRDCTKRYPFLINGVDDRFSIGLSNGEEPISKWVLPMVENENMGADLENNFNDSIVSTIDNNKEGIQQDMNQSETPSLPVNTTDNEPHSDNLTKEDSSTSNSIDQPSLNKGEKRKLDDTALIIPKEPKKLKSDDCQNVDLASLPAHDHVELFLQEGWRDGLCMCDKCKETYKKKNVEYFLKEEKTFEPEEDEDAGKSVFEIGMEQLQRVDRVQALESLMAYKTLADDIKSYLSAFKESGKIVTKEDVEEFFAAKRQERKG
ncbi:hypothetical protein BDB01DRAFT_772728 [Pilobolus umbonatus]|nr:hypothetical protein BDB01DRAFT_772728 [Pilobolus umbonatus]